MLHKRKPSTSWSSGFFPFLYLFISFFSPPAGVGEGSRAAEFIDRGGRFHAFAGATHDITSAAPAAFRWQDVLLLFARLSLPFISLGLAFFFILHHLESRELFELTVQEELRSSGLVTFFKSFV